MANTAISLLRDALEAAEEDLHAAQETVNRIREVVRAEEARTGDPSSPKKPKARKPLPKPKRVFGQARPGVHPVVVTIETAEGILKRAGEALTMDELFGEFDTIKGGIDRKLFRTRVDSERRSGNIFTRTLDGKWDLLSRTRRKA